MFNTRAEHALFLIQEGHTAQDIMNLLGYSNPSAVYNLARSHNLKICKAHAQQHDEMRRYKADGHTMQEVADKFGVSKGTAQQICKGIAPQESHRAPSNKGTLQNIDNVVSIINERAEGFEYAGNYTGTNGTVDLRCKTCGYVHTHSWWGIRRNGVKACPNCQKIEKQKREQEQKEVAEKKRKEKRINSERKKQGKQAIRLLRHALKLHRCPVCGSITDRKIYCSDKCKARANETKKDLNRRKKIQNALVDKDISLQKLYERDKGICSICGGKCDWDDHHYKGRYFIVGKTYPTIDHVIPLSKGGQHSWDNVKLAHQSCNSAKGANLVG